MILKSELIAMFLTIKQSVAKRFYFLILFYIIIIHILNSSLISIAIKISYMTQYDIIVRLTQHLFYNTGCPRYRNPLSNNCCTNAIYFNKNPCYLCVLTTSYSLSCVYRCYTAIRTHVSLRAYHNPQHWRTRHKREWRIFKWYNIIITMI